MKLRILLLLIVLLAGTASAQTQGQAKFMWAQPDTTIQGIPIGDGWLSMYEIFVAARGDTVLHTRTDAPHAIADSVSAYVAMDFFVPLTVRVRAIDKWDGVGLFSEWSEIHIIVPGVAAEPSKPGVVE